MTSLPEAAASELGHLDFALDAPGLAPLFAHFAEFANAPHIAFAARSDAVTKPMLLHDNAPVELVALGLFLFELKVAPGFERSKPLFEPARRPAIEPDRRPGQIGEQAFVMADEHESGTRFGELLFQPFDRHEIEMVGRLVEQQDFRLGREGPHERGAPGLAAGKRSRPPVGIDPELLHQRPRAIGIVLLAEPAENIFGDVLEGRKVGLLLQIGHARAWLGEAGAAVGLDIAGGDLEQRRFARSIAPDEGDALPWRDRQLGAVQQRVAAQSQTNVSQLQKRRHMKGARRGTEVDTIRG